MRRARARALSLAGLVVALLLGLGPLHAVGADGPIATGTPGSNLRFVLCCYDRPPPDALTRNEKQAAVLAGLALLMSAAVIPRRRPSGARPVRLR
jgi:hypothetical protein